MYSRCEAFVFPSLYEGFGLPLTEAMSFGKPLLTATNSALREVAGDAAIDVEAENTQSIADALNRLATEPHLRHTLAEAARTRSLQFSWDTAAASTLTVLEAAASS